MNEERKVPAIRFKGFTDDWEQRKVSEVAEIFKSGGTRNKDEPRYSRRMPLLK